MTTYVPQIGQLARGNAWGEFELPDGVADYVCEQLRTLTRLLRLRGAPVASGFLGGEDGYGAEYVGEAFEMHPYWWGDCTCSFDAADEEWWEHRAHLANCYQSDLDALRKRQPSGPYGLPAPVKTVQYKALCLKHGVPWDDGKGCAAHCTCGLDKEYATWRETNDHARDCCEVRPNFRCGDIEIRWYKYVGRGMSVNREVTRREIEEAFARCRAALVGGTGAP